ncbi:MAG: glucosyl-3-phosphoglycerate synthase [Actinomycetota bacterium]|nr:glucosyl-3-phosphoglycerate synthase [Actinomycetota bacterium]
MKTGWDPEVEAWFRRRTFDGRPPTVADLVASKQGFITVCLPALDEGETIEAICETVVDELIGPGLVDELIVIDSGSSDNTIEAARAAGAVVHRAAEVMTEIPAVSGGKGESLWKSLAVAQGDIVVWLDSDTRNFDTRFVTALVAPLLEDGATHLVKAFYERPLVAAEEGDAGDRLRRPLLNRRAPRSGTLLERGGARVTEIGIRPLINLFFPKLAGFVQPLSGEYAGRTEILRSLPFATGYAVDVSLLIDVVESFGLDAVAQVDLGSRVHRNRAVPELGRMSFEIMHSLFARLDDDGRVKLTDALAKELIQFEDSPDGPVPVTCHVEPSVRPPMRRYLG